MKKLLLLLLIVALGYGAYFAYTRYFNGQAPAPPRSTVQIGDTVYTVELADSDNKRAQGLSGRESLAANHGMLFLFDQRGIVKFWMRGMLIPLDFVWIDDTTIIDLTENVSAPITQTYTPPPFGPSIPFDKVLEINAGEIKKHGFTVGQEVNITLLKPLSSP